VRSPQLCLLAKLLTLSWQVFLFLFYPLRIYNLYNTYGQCEGLHSTALVIEDAETLGALLSRVESPAQVSQLIMAYEDIRHPRCVQMYKQDWHLETILKYPIGPQQELRDRVLRQTLVYEDWDMLESSGFQTVLGDQLSSFAYDATEAVEDWWASRVKNTPFWRMPLQVWIRRE
jgi:hypothetical protein